MDVLAELGEETGTTSNRDPPPAPNRNCGSRSVPPPPPSSSPPPLISQIHEPRQLHSAMQVDNIRQQDRLQPSYYNAKPLWIQHQASAYQPHTAILSNGTMRFGPDIRETKSTSYELRKNTSLLDLPFDIFLHFLNWLEIPDVINLRRVCKGLERATRQHSAWAIIATRHVIGANLPWPTWALPLTAISSQSLEELTVQAILMKKHWDGGNSTTIRKFTRCIERPWESVTWLGLLQSRWLAIQQFGASLELWDLKKASYDRPSLVIESVCGIVDGFAVSAQTGSSITWMISTRLHQTLTITLDISSLENVETSSLGAQIVNSTYGFSRLVETDGHLAAFLSCEGKHGAFVKDMRTGRFIRQVFGVQFKSTFIAVSTASTLELYSRSATQIALTSAYGSKTFLCLAQPRVASPEHPKYHFFSKAILFPHPFSPLFISIGQSGRRLIFVTDEPYGLSLCGVAIPADLSGHRSTSSMRKDWVGWWRITDRSSKDLVQHVVFDEATGTCALGMGSGHIWVANMVTATAIPQSYTEPWGSPPETSTPRADLSWPLSHPLPWPALYYENDTRRPADREGPVAWSTEVDLYYPCRNQHDCFGGASWFTNELLNMPGPASTLFFNAPMPEGNLEWGVEIIGIGDRLVAILKEYEFDGFSVFLLDQHIALEDAIAHLRGGGQLSALPSRELPFNSGPLERYIAWRDRVDLSHERILSIW
ncbi:hypothetical protein M407DRAFT_229704 [Tulasnella calospora MUT 4182]|uniref:F-box domain-containing protein n=1 Tax=Tulasnella calospora MUT 4182 TaxID=1051891 RepID=A0A0C3MJF4_9AGAM|nr:hypothetical protein M407DRAFT_229704 [Tulasnella calospora MUT 4182]